MIKNGKKHGENRKRKEKTDDKEQRKRKLRADKVKKEEGRTNMEVTDRTRK